MKEIIISYENEKEAQKLFNELENKRFLLVRQNNETKQLFFRKALKKPSTHLVDED